MAMMAIAAALRREGKRFLLSPLSPEASYAVRSANSSWIFPTSSSRFCPVSAVLSPRHSSEQAEIRRVDGKGMPDILAEFKDRMVKVDRSLFSDGEMQQKILGFNHISPCHSYKPPNANMQNFPRGLCTKAQRGTEKSQADSVHSHLNHSIEKDNMGLMPDRSDVAEGKRQQVISFSPLEARISGLRNESLKIKRNELSQKLTYALMPALLIISKTKLTTSLLILSVYWQIYGFFKEIFLDYVHQEVTRKWVLIYFKLLLIILAKETLLDFDLV